MKPRIEPKLLGDEHLKSVEKTLDAFLQGVNDTASSPRPPRELTQFEQLDHATGEAEIAAAQDLVNEAQNFLNETKARVEKKRLDTEHWVQEYQTKVDRQRALSNKVLAAHQEYHNIKKED